MPSLQNFKSPVLAVVLATLTVGLAGCREQSLYSNLKQSEANQIVAVLQRAGISASIASEPRTGTQEVRVAPGDIAEASQVLARAGLPRQRDASLRDVLPKDSWMASPLEERARLAYGLSQELRGTLTDIPGIVDARVHLALAEKNALGQTTAQPTASVLVNYNPDLIGADYQDNIRSLVANSVAGLNYDRVTVTMVPYDGAPPPVATAAAPLVPGVPAWLSKTFYDLFKIAFVLALTLAATAVLLRILRVKR